MGFANYDVSSWDADGTIGDTMNFVELDTEDITLTLPSANGGDLVIVNILTHPRVALTSGVVRIVPGTGDYFFGGAAEVVTWELGSTVKLIAVDSTYWRVVDVL